MTETKKITGIVLKRQSFRENDSLVTLFSRELGKIDLVCRGAKKFGSKMAGHIEPLNFSSIMWIKGKQLDYVGSVQCLDAYKNIKEDLEKSLYAGVALKTFNKWVKPEMRDSSLFLLLVDYLETLNNNFIENKELFFKFFKIKLISLLGYSPELYLCHTCNTKIKPKKYKFDICKGGVVCTHCDNTSRNKAISLDGIKALRIVLNYNFSKIVKFKTNQELGGEVGVIIDRFIAYHINY